MIRFFVFIASLTAVPVCFTVAQVPVIVEPIAFQFENYANKTITTIPESPRIGVIPRLETPRNSMPPLDSQVPNPSILMIEKHYVTPGMSPQDQVKYADAQIRLYELDKKRNQNQINEASAIFEEMRIEYELPFQDAPEKQIYALAFQKIQQMLEGRIDLNLERAVFLSEHAFDPSLNFNDFDAQLNKAASIIGLKMQQDGIPAADNLGKIMTTFKYMADTISVLTKLETKITTYPKTYDFQDFWGRQDYKKMFVSKLLREGSGQCHSMPLLFLLLCEKTGTEASLAFAPNHSFIKFQDKRGKWHNIELTNGMLASDHFMVESGYIKAEALQNKIYLEPLTKKQVIVQCLNDLALGYQKKYGYDPFVKECATTALAYDSTSLTASQILANYHVALLNYIIYQYKQKGLSKSNFNQDEEAQGIVKRTDKANQRIETLGYADMPPEAYEAWLNSIKNEAYKQQHSNELKILGNIIER